MATAAESVVGVEAAAPAGKKGKTKLLVLLLVLVLAGGGALWFLGLIPYPPAATTSEEHAAGGEKGAHENAHPVAHGADVGAMRPLEPFVANLADEESSRYLKITLQVEFAGSEPSALLDARMPQVRDVVLTLITSKTFADIRTPEGKERMREEIIDRINHVLAQPAVKTIYFTDFIVQ